MIYETADEIIERVLCENKERRREDNAKELKRKWKVFLRGQKNVKRGK